MIKITEYYSPTCIPCKILKQKIKALQEDKDFLFEEIDATLEDYGIQSTPHIKVISDGKELLNEHVTSIQETINKIKNFL